MNELPPQMQQQIFGIGGTDPPPPTECECPIHRAPYPSTEVRRSEPPVQLHPGRKQCAVQVQRDDLRHMMVGDELLGFVKELHVKISEHYEKLWNYTLPEDMWTELQVVARTI